MKKTLFSPNALTILEKRYLRKNENGVVIETPEEMLFRVADNVAKAEHIYNPEADIKKITDNFYGIMANLDFLPNSPTLMNAGTKLQQLSACFVLPVGDSMEEIFEAIKNTALIHKSGGGTGFSFSSIRPNNDLVKSTKGVSSGPVSFMMVFDAATETIKQGGTRRGANMGMLRVDHPDILDFIQCKKTEGKLANFNISVALTENFMNALKKNEYYDLINPRTKQPAGKLKAEEVFEKIVQYAWENGEPGIVFIDRINEFNPTPDAGEIEATNPCGEQPLLAYESCNLGSINLGRMTVLRNGKREIDFAKIVSTTRTAVHFLDNVIDVNKYPLPMIENMTKSNRKIGLGVMGFADMLIDLEIPYNSEQAIDTAEQVMSFIEKEAKNKSKELAKERGVFTNFHGSTHDTQGIRLRNATVTTIAPTGTISMLAGASSGIEPLFALVYNKLVLDDNGLLEINNRFEKITKEQGFYSDELMKLISEKASLQNIFGIPEHIKKVFVTSHDINPEWHIRIQASFQKYTDNAVSKTVNFPNKAKKEDVEKVFKLAHKLGCKGVTVYRDGSRKKQVINIDQNKGSERKEDTQHPFRIKPRQRPPVTIGTTEQTRTGCGSLYINVNRDEHGPCEVFAHMGKAGGCAASNTEATGRLISVALRAGVDPQAIIDQLQGIRCPIPTWHNGEMILSCADAIGKILAKHIQELDSENSLNIRNSILDSGNPPECPECGNILVMESGCILCPNPQCGYSKC